MKKLILPAIAIFLVASSVNANPRFKNQKHFAKDFDANAKVEYPISSLSAINQGPIYKNFGHEYAASEQVYLDNANQLVGPKYKNERNFAAPSNVIVEDVRPEIAMK